LGLGKAGVPLISPARALIMPAHAVSWLGDQSKSSKRRGKRLCLAACGSMRIKMRSRGRKPTMEAAVKRRGAHCTTRSVRRQPKNIWMRLLHVIVRCGDRRRTFQANFYFFRYSFKLARIIFQKWLPFEIRLRHVHIVGRVLDLSCKI